MWIDYKGKLNIRISLSDNKEHVKITVIQRDILWLKNGTQDRLHELNRLIDFEMLAQVIQYPVSGVLEF